MRRSLFFALLLGAIIGRGAGAFAAEKVLSGLPEWMLGQWVVTKVYEERYTPYPDPRGEPINWLSNQIMTVEPKRIELGKRVCVNFSIHQDQKDLDDLLMSQYGISQDDLEIENHRKGVSFVKIRCEQAIIMKDDYSNYDSYTGPMNWYIVISNQKQLEMPFYGGSYLELHRLASTT